MKHSLYSVYSQDWCTNAFTNPSNNILKDHQPTDLDTEDPSTSVTYPDSSELKPTSIMFYTVDKQT